MPDWLQFVLISFIVLTVAGMISTTYQQVQTLREEVDKLRQSIDAKGFSRAKERV